jgi:hypothetical protein
VNLLSTLVSTSHDLENVQRRRHSPFAQVSEMKPVYPAPGMPAAGGGGILYGEHIKLEHCETKYR